MAASQRVSRGFHRLALFLAAIPLLIGIGDTFFIVNKHMGGYHDLQCAQDHAAGVVPPLNSPNNPWKLQGPDDGAAINLKQIGCAGYEGDVVTYGEARAPFLSSFVEPVRVSVTIWLAVTLAVYGLVRAIGWVIGGFVS